MYEQPVLAVENPQSFATIKQAIDRELGASGAARFLSRVHSKRLRVRDFAQVLGKDLLGRDTRLQYEKLNDSDRGQVREHYLHMVERVPVDAREKYFRVYANY